jgi:hypothetical protein
MTVQLRPPVYLDVHVFRKEPFWVLVLERWGEGEYAVAKLVLAEKPDLDGFEVKAAAALYFPEDDV